MPVLQINSTIILIRIVGTCTWNFEESLVFFAFFYFVPILWTIYWFFGYYTVFRPTCPKFDSRGQSSSNFGSFDLKVWGNEHIFNTEVSMERAFFFFLLIYGRIFNRKSGKCLRSEQKNACSVETAVFTMLSSQNFRSKLPKFEWDWPGKGFLPVLVGPACSKVIISWTRCVPSASLSFSSLRVCTPQPKPPKRASAADYAAFPLSSAVPDGGLTVAHGGLCRPEILTDDRSSAPAPEQSAVEPRGSAGARGREKGGFAAQSHGVRADLKGRPVNEEWQRCGI